MDVNMETYKLAINSYVGEDLQGAIDEHNREAAEIATRLQELEDMSEWAFGLPAGGGGVVWNELDDLFGRRRLLSMELLDFRRRLLDRKGRLIDEVREFRKAEVIRLEKALERARGVARRQVQKSSPVQLQKAGPVGCDVYERAITPRIEETNAVHGLRNEIVAMKNHVEQLNSFVGAIDQESARLQDAWRGFLQACMR